MISIFNKRNGVIMIEINLESVTLDIGRGMSFMLLKDVADSRALQIYISPEHAENISNLLENRTPLRPSTHDLIVSTFDSHDIKVDRILIRSLIDNTFFASIFTSHNGQIQELDARPSDAIAIAIRTKAPIGATEELMTLASVAVNPS
jgi:uncharacterized protein